MNPQIIRSNIGYFLVKEILDYYDEPLLFSCYDNTGRLFLAIVIDEIEGINKWLFVPTSSERLEKIKRGLIPLKKAFTDSEVDWLFETNGSLFSKQGVHFNFALRSSVSEELLPDDDIYLEPIEDMSYSEAIEDHFFDKIAIQRLADNTQLETLRITLKTPANIPIGMVAAETLGSFLSRVQSLFLSFITPGRGRKPEYIKANTRLNVLAGFNEGSFIFDLQQDKTDEILNDNFLGEVSLPAFIKIVEAVDDKEKLIEVTKDINLISISHYDRLLRVLSSGNCGIDLQWASPQRKVKETSLTPTQIRSIITLLDQEDSMKGRNFTAYGELVMAHSKKHRFELNTFDGNTYTGTIDPALNKYRFEISSFVEATIEETIKLNAKQERSFFKLVDVKVLSEEEIGTLLSREDD